MAALTEPDRQRMRMKKVSALKQDELQNTDHMIDLLAHTFVGAAQESLQREWRSGPHVTAVKNIASDRPQFFINLLNYAASKEHKAFPLRQAIASYIALETSKPCTQDEVYALSQFMDNIAPLLTNKAFGTLYQDAAYHLVVSAGKFGKSVSSSDRAVFQYRSEILSGLLPTVTKASSNDPFIIVSRVESLLPLANGSVGLSGALQDIASDAVERMPPASDALILPYGQAILDYTVLGKSISQDDNRIARHVELWHGMIDSMHMLSAADAVNIARTVVRGGVKAHDAVRKRAEHIVLNYRIPYLPDNHPRVLNVHWGHTKPVFH